MASFSTPFIRRPVATIMLNISLMIFGVLGLMRLPVRELPDIDPPVVNVLAIYPGASAQVVESEVTEILEDAISGVEQIKTLTSTSREQVSSIQIEFNTAQDIEIAAQDVRDAVARSRGNLPDDVDEPIVSKQDANARPVIWIAFYSDRFNTEQLTRIADNQVRERLQNVPGVSNVIIGGEKRRAIRLRIDSQQMASRGVTIQDIDAALQNQNVELPSGRLESRDLELTIQTRGELKSPEEFDRLVVRKDEQGIVYFRDVGAAEWGVEDERSIARFRAKPAVGLGIVRQSKANTLQVASGVKAMMDQIAPTLPEGINYSYPYDESVFIENAVIEVWQTLGIAFGLVVLTIFIFLRSPRATLVPVLAIPVSIMATFGCMYALGYSVNIFTLLALVLAIGLVVDDAIVVLENIYRHIEEGKKPMDAAFMAMDEISFAVIATTLSLVAVFLPLAFIGGITGRLLLEFAVALSFSVMVSSLVALTLAPMVAGRVLKPKSDVQHGAMFRMFERGFDRISARYERTLGWVLRHRLLVMVVGGLSVVASRYLFLNLDNEFLPEEDKGRMITFALTPQGSTPEFTNRQVQQIEQILLDTPEVDSFFAAIALPFNGPGDATRAFVFIRLKSGERRHIRDIVSGPTGLMARYFGEVEGAFAIPLIPKAVDTGFEQPFQLVLQNPNLEELNDATTLVLGKLREGGWVANPRPQFELNKPELEITFDRNRLADLGISIAEISRTLQVNFGGVDLSDLKLDGKQYQVIAQLSDADRMTPDNVRNQYVRSASGELVPMSSVVSVKVKTGPNQINRYQRQRASIIEATPAGQTLGSAVALTEEMLAEVLPEGISYTWGGEAEDLQESSADIYGFFLLAVLVVYMVLAAQFESFIHPFTVMLSLPLAFLGAFALLYGLAWVNVLGTNLYGWVTYAPDPPGFAVALQKIVPRISSMNLNIFSQVGLVLLVGLVTKNSILLVEFANQLMEKGMTAKEAMLEAGSKRLRPILMTSMATIMGILPIAIGFGDAAESRRPLGVVAVGGMISSTILTLLVIPVVYTLFAELQQKWKKKPE
jgi:hydrophobe/amphiphile efflux-1 (HAE1) family protein